MTIEKAFQVPETVPLICEVKVNGVYHDPNEAMTVTLWDPEEVAVFEDQTAEKVGVGRYVRYWNPPDNAKRGVYTYRHFAQDGTGTDARKTVVYKTFELQ